MFFGHNKNEPWSGVLRNQSKNPIEKTIKLVWNKLEFTKDIILETRPMVWWIAILDANTKNDTGDHGWNMDTKELWIGTTLVLHDTSGIWKIILWDVHALMGDGEICWTGVEIPANVEIQIDIIHNTRNHRPLLITSDYIITIATRDTHEKAYTQCIADMVAYVQQEHSLSFEEANWFVSAVCDLRVSTVVSRLCTYKILLPIQYCKNRKDLII